MQLIYVWSAILLVNASIMTSSNVERPERDLVWIKRTMAYLLGFKPPKVNRRILYKVPLYPIVKSAKIVPDYTKQYIYQGLLTHILIPCNMLQQPLRHLENLNVPVYIYNTNECTYRPRLDTDSFKIHESKDNIYSLPDYNQIQKPTAVYEGKKSYSRKKNLMEDKLNEKPIKLSEEAKITTSKLPSYQKGEQTSGNAKYTTVPKITVTENSFDNLASSTFSAAATQTTDSTIFLTSIYSSTKALAPLVVATSELTTTNTNDSAFTTLPSSTLAATTTLISSPQDTTTFLTAVTPETIATTDSPNLGLKLLQTTSSSSLAQSLTTSLAQQESTKDLTIFTNSIKATSLSKIRNESDSKNTTEVITTLPNMITELSDQFSTDGSCCNGEINYTEDPNFGESFNSIQEKHAFLDNSKEDWLLPLEKKENSRGDIPDMIT